jgi:hypothetical protein
MSLDTLNGMVVVQIVVTLKTPRLGVILRSLKGIVQDSRSLVHCLRTLLEHAAQVVFRLLGMVPEE